MSFNKTIQIGSKTIGPDHPTYFIAEIGGNFDGNKEKAKRLIDAAKEAGARLALYGHTHTALHEDVGGVKVINPGTA